MPLLVSDEILERVKRIEIDWNRHGIDKFGADQIDLARLLTMLAWFYRKYFTVTVNGISHVPPQGRAMIVCNHTGGVAVDAAMILVSLLLEMEPPRLGQGMAEKFISRVPFASQFTARAGQLTGLPEHAVQLLEDERLLMVFPEGARGTAKLYGDRHTLVGFGTGFMRLALQTNTPIIPTAFLGGGEAIPTVINLERLGKLFGVPYIPITPYILPVPRPVELEIYYSEPMVFEGTGNEEDSVITGYVNQVKDRVATLIDQGHRIRAGRDSEAS
jgi:1-acyl-sn-glycerol-3-phosphate acyltransferase